MTPLPERFVAPDYSGACIANVVPALVAAGRPAAWLPDAVRDAGQVVVFVIDGLGWLQLQERGARLAPCLSSMDGSAITSVAPTTTSAALASIVFGAPPATHGVLGYSVGTDDGLDSLNTLTWRTGGAGDARDSVRPSSFSPMRAFGGRPVPVVARAEFAGTGFTVAVFDGAPLAGWSAPSSIPLLVRAQLDAGAPLVYAYYDGVDKVSHACGLGEYYDAELRAADALVASVVAALPRGAVVLVTSDHGQVDVGGSYVEFDDEVMSDVSMLSGDSRFRWLHARDGGRVDALLGACRERYEATGLAVVRTFDEVDAAGWLGGPLPASFRRRVGDVLVAAVEPVAFVAPGAERTLRSRHGSLTAAEVLVPLLVGVAAG